MTEAMQLPLRRLIQRIGPIRTWLRPVFGYHFLYAIRLWLFRNYMVVSQKVAI